MRGIELAPPKRAAGRTLGSRAVEFAKQGLSFAAVAGATFYAVARTLLSSFYERFGVSPEELGWDTRTVLTRFALQWFVLVAIAVIITVQAFQARDLVGRFIRFVAKINVSLSIGVIVVISAVITSPFLLVGEDYVRTRERISAGQQVSLARVIDLFPVESYCVSLQALKSSEPLPLDLTIRGTYLLLGSNDGRTVLYDPQHHRTLRVPSGVLLLATARCGGDTKLTPYGLRPNLLVLLTGSIVVVALLAARRRIREAVPRAVRGAVREAERRATAVALERSISRVAVRGRLDARPLVPAALQAFDALVDGLPGITIEHLDSENGSLRYRLTPTKGPCRRLRVGELQFDVVADGEWLVIEQHLHQYRLERILVIFRGWIGWVVRPLLTPLARLLTPGLKPLSDDRLRMCAERLIHDAR